MNLPDRHHHAVIELELHGIAWVELGREGVLQYMFSETGMAPQCLMGKDRLHERFGRAFVFIADANAERRDIVEEKITPVIGGMDDQNVGSGRLDALAELREFFIQPGTVFGIHGFPHARDIRRVPRRETPDQLSHGRSLPNFARVAHRHAAHVARASILHRRDHRTAESCA